MCRASARSSASRSSSSWADAPDRRHLRPGRRRQGDDRARPARPRPDAVAEPLLDHPAPAAGRARGRLRLRRPRAPSSTASSRAASWSGPSSSATSTARRLPEAPRGADVVLEIEVDGARQVRERHPDALLIFVLPPSRQEQERRLRGRGDPPDRGGRAAAQGRGRGADRPRPGRRRGGQRRPGRHRRPARSPSSTSTAACPPERRPRCYPCSAGPRAAEHPANLGDPMARTTHDTMMEPADRGAPRPGRLQVPPGHAGGPPRPPDQLLLQPPR